MVKACSKCGDTHYARYLCRKHYSMARGRGEFTSVPPPGDWPQRPEDPDETWQRYISKVDVTDEASCWPWKAATNHAGYGIFRWQKQMHLSHRWMFQFLLLRPLGPKEVVRHSCDNPPCQNLSHLLPGTQWDNAQDAVARNRYPDRRGVKNVRSKLSPEEVLHIFRSKESRPLLAERFGVSHQSISNIQLSITWAHLTGDKA